MFALDEYGMSDPWFCKYICPAGTLEGGLPLAVLNEGIRASIGWLYAYKVAILVALIIVSIIVYRPFCKYICPLGAIYSAFNKISVFKLRCDESKCISCGKCARACKMNVDPTKAPDSTECIRCGKCISECPVDALKISAKK